jgi:hypothetical protein
MGTASPGRAAATLGGTFGCCASVLSASVVIPLRSRFSKITVVTLVAIALCTAGSSASGATVATYWSVSESSMLAHTDVTDSGASTQASVSRTADDTAHQGDRLGFFLRGGDTSAVATWASSSATRARRRSTSLGSLMSGSLLQPRGSVTWPTFQREGHPGITQPG